MRVRWDAGAGSAEAVDPANVKQVRGEMLRKMYDMRGPREKMVGGGHANDANHP